jgi:flagellar motility protein MotE (MotC chaperone)
MNHIDDLKSKIMTFSKSDSSNVDQSLKQLESRVNSRLASSVEELASIIKDYAKKHKKLSDKVTDLISQKQ